MEDSQIMRFLKIAFVLGLTMCSVSVYADLSIPVAHLQDKRLTEGYTKSLSMEMKGYLQVGDERLPSKITARSSPATEVHSEDGKVFLKITFNALAESGDEKIDLSGYELYEKQTLRPVKTVMSDGEVTLYRSYKDYPEIMRVGAKELISRSDTYAPNDLKRPEYKTTEILTLERVGLEPDLFELCETEYEYSRASNYKKSQGEHSSCYIINSKGELLGYAALVNTPTSRATYQGTVKVE